MTPNETVTAVAIVNAAVWLAVIVLNWRPLREQEPMPDALRHAIVVALPAASLGSAVSALGFVAAIPSEWSVWFSAAWRAAMLAAGPYALAATLRRRRSQ